MGKMMRLALGGLGVAALTLLAPRVYTALKYRAQIYALNDAPTEHVAIVFGAGLRRGGRPTPVLYDRVATAAELYRLGKAGKLLMTGDGVNNAETVSMRITALEIGVPEKDIVLDPEGLDTYASCYRAKALFGIERALLVTQNFHLPRALFICDGLGLAASGISADRRQYLRRSTAWWNFREIFATANAWWELTMVKPTPMP